MKKSLIGKAALLLATGALLLSGRAHAFWVCGDGVCSTTGPHPETCDSCPEDCGTCRAIASARSGQSGDLATFLALITTDSQSPKTEIPQTVAPSSK